MGDTPEIELGSRLICEGREFVVINYSLMRDHGGYLLRFEAQDPIIALSRQMETEKARRDRERATKFMDRIEEEMDKGEEWKKDKNGDPSGEGD